MKPLSIHHSNVVTVAGLLAPWSRRPSYHQQTNHSDQLLHRTSPDQEVPDFGYWTAYDHFMTEYEVRVQRAAYFCGLLQRGWRRLAGALVPLIARAPHQTRATG